MSPNSSPVGITQPPSHPVRFPTDISRKLDGPDLRILEEINYLSRCQAKKSPSGAKYCCPSEEYLGRKVGLSRARVSDHVRKLENLGLLRVTRRGQIHGKWRTNMYQIVSWAWWKLVGCLNRLKPRKWLQPKKSTPKPPAPCANRSTQTIPKREKETPEGLEESRSGSIEDFRAALKQYFPQYLKKR